MTSLSRAASAAQGHKFDLDAETEEQLLAVFSESTAQRERLQRRIAKAKKNADTLEQLLLRREQLLQRSSALASSITDGANLLIDGPSANSSTTSGVSTADRSGRGAVGAARNSTTSIGVAAPPDSTPLGGHDDHSPVGALSACQLAEEDHADEDEAVPPSWGQDSSHFRYRGPSGSPGIVSAVFPTGQLYRIICDGGVWSFYNDTREYEMHVLYVLGDRSEVVAAMSPDEECERVRKSRRVVHLPNGQWEAAVLVPPEQTVPLLTGTVTDFEERCKAVLVAAEGSAPAGQEQELCREAWDAWAAITDSVGSAAAFPAVESLTACSELPAIAAAAVRDSEAVLAECVQRRLPFVDARFFPAYTRLFRAGVDAFAIPPLHWRSPRTFLPPRAQGSERLFTGALSPDVIQQGQLFPDDNFLSVVAALTAVPGAVSSLFTHPETASRSTAGTPARRQSAASASRMTTQQVLEETVGAHRIQLCLSGWWRSVLVDTFVPAAAHCPEFAHCRDDLRALWLQLLEKAYAKAFGSYAALLEASVPDVAAHLSGAVCSSLASFWPTQGAAAGTADDAEKKTKAFEKLLTTHTQTRGGLVLFRAFPLTLAKSKGKRDQLEEIYQALGLQPGTSVVMTRVGEVSTGHTLVRLRATSFTASSTVPGAQGRSAGKADCMQYWRQCAKPWADSTWELTLDTCESGFSSEATDPTGPAVVSTEGELWMELADVPQFFQEGYLLSPTARWRGDEVRVRGHFVGECGRPAACLKIEVTAPTSVCISLTQAEPRFSALNATAGDAVAEDTEVGDGHAVGKRASTSAVIASATEVRGVALQLLGKGREAGTCALLHNSTSPDIYASSPTLQFAFQRDVGIGVELVPERSPYYVIPRVASSACGALSAAQGHTPYVLSVMAKDTPIGRGVTSRSLGGAAATRTPVQVSFVEAKPTAGFLRTSKSQVGSCDMKPSEDVNEVAAEYQLCHVGGGRRALIHNKRIDVV